MAHPLLIALIIQILLQTTSACNGTCHDGVHVRYKRDLSTPSTGSNNIKDAILDKINEFSTTNGNHVELLEKIENTKIDPEKALPAATSSPLLTLPQQPPVSPPLFQIPTDSTIKQNFLAQNPLNSMVENFVDSLTPSQKTLPINIHVQSKQLVENDDGYVTEVRDWRKKFYKAFRDAKRNKESAQNSYPSDPKKMSGTDFSDDSNNRKIALFEKVPKDRDNNDDWAKFLSIKAEPLKAENVLHSQLPLSVENTGYQINGSWTAIEPSYTLNLPSSTAAPKFYFRSYQQMNRSDPVPIIIEIPTYRQLEVTSQDQYGYQITTTTVYPSYYTNIPYTAAYPLQSSYYTNIEQQQQQPSIQLLTEFNRTSVYTTGTPLNFYTTPSEPTNDEFSVFDNDNYEQQSPTYASSHDFAETFQPDERCNSYNLRSIMLSNMVENDSESSKRAIQEAAENAFGNYYNVICGTGFFSYIAHTGEYCLVSTLGINCYVFSPICKTTMMPFADVKLHGTKNTSNKK